MSSAAQQILEQALELDPEDRAALVSELVASLEKADEHVDALWANEVRERLAAYDAGQMTETSAEEVFRRVADR